MVLGRVTRRWGYVLAAVIGITLWHAPWEHGVQARTQAGRAAETPTAGDQEFQEWLTALRDEARGKGISEATLNKALRDVAPVLRVIELDRRQPEFVQTFWTYLKQRVTDERIERGRALLVKHRDLLHDIQERYGVPPHYLVAFWGLETNFGDYLGGFRVIDVLATLAYDRRRTSFFRTELLNALTIIEQGHILPDAMIGSWAGAMGHMQFMPSTFIGHAVDYTADGRKDIWGSLPDAFSSAANYLADMGWRPRRLWGREVRLPENFDLRLATLSIKKPLAQWSALGVRRAYGSALPEADMEGSIVLPQGHRGPAFLVYDNFRIILRWNRSIHYALTVGHLADRIAGRPPIINGRDADHEALSTKETEEIQRFLNRLGFDAGAEDGIPGPRTREAIRSFQKAHALPPDGYPSPTLLKRLRYADGKAP